MIAAGSVYAGNEYSFIGPHTTAAPILPGHIRLNAFGHQAYLATTVLALFDAIGELTNAIARGEIRPIGDPANRRGADIVYEAVLEVAISNTPPSPVAETESTDESRQP